MNDDEADLFRKAVSGAKPLQSEERVAAAQRKPKPKARFSRADEDAALRESLAADVDDTEAHGGESLRFHRPHVGKRTMRKLARGSFSVQAEIDLHGMTVAEAKPRLAEFIESCARDGKLCVRVVHGKGLGSGQRGPGPEAKGESLAAAVGSRARIRIDAPGRRWHGRDLRTAAFGLNLGYLIEDACREPALRQGEVEPQCSGLELPVQVGDLLAQRPVGQFCPDLFESRPEFGVAFEHAGLDPRHLPACSNRAQTVKCCSRMDVHFGAASFEFRVYFVNREDAAGAIEISDLTREDAIPAAGLYASAENFIEQKRSRRRYSQASLVSPQAFTREQSLCQRKVGAVASEALRAEIVRHAVAGNLLKPIFDRRPNVVTEFTAQHDPETVAAMRAPAQLARMALLPEQSYALAFETRPHERVAASRNAEPLSRYRVPVLEPGETDVRNPDIRVTRKLARHPCGVGAGFLDPQKIVLAVSPPARNPVLR